MAIATTSDEPTDAVEFPYVVARVLLRHPLVSPDLVRRCVRQAAEHFRDARVRQYLPILVERWACDALHAAGPSANAMALDRSVAASEPAVELANV